MDLRQANLRFLAAFTSAIALLFGCQSTSGPDTPPSSALTAKAMAEYSEVLRLPDSGVWRTNNKSRSDSGNGKITCIANTKGKHECSESVALKSPLGSDLLYQDAYALGVQFATLTYSQTNSQTDLTYKSVLFLPMEEKLLRAFNVSYKQSHSAAQAPTATDLVGYYVDLLLSADTLVTGKAIPRGMVLDSIKKALVLAASRKEVSAKALASRSLLGLTNESIHSYMGILVKAGLIKDTTSLYPLDPVRVVDSIHVATDLVAGEGPVAVSGSFAWNTKWAVKNPEVLVKTTGGDDDSVVARFDKFPDLTSGSWVLTGKVTLQAKKGAKIGLDTLVINLIGDSGRATSRTTFRVVRGDTSTPSIHVVDSVKVGSDLVAGEGLAQVSGAFTWNPKWPVRNFLVKIRNAQGPEDSVGVIFDKVPDPSSGSWILGGNVSIKARLGARIGLDTLVVTLSGDSGIATSRTTFRVLRGNTPDRSIHVVDSVKVGSDLVAGKGSIPVSGAFSWDPKWPVRNVLVKIRNAQGPEDSIRVSFNKLLDPASGSWILGGNVSIQAQQGARIGLDTLVVTLSGDSGIATSRTTFHVLPGDTVPVTPAVDSIGPSIVWVAPKTSTSVDAATASYALQVKVTDPSGVDSVFIQGTLAKKEGADIYSQTLSLPKPDGNPIKVLVRARDAKGNQTADSSVSIARKAPDSTDKPQITLLKPTTATGNKLVFDSTTLHVEADITDALLAVTPASVLFNSTAAKATGTVFAADVPVPATGKPFTITIKASNSNGTTSTLEVEVTRATDTTKPVIVRAAGASNREIPYDSATTKLSWKITDNHQMGEVKVNGSAVTGSVDLYTYSAIALKVGANGFKLEAKDSSGNLATDSVTITRAWKDTLAPTINRSTGTGPKTVLYEDSVYTPSWKVTDTLLKEVTIQSVVVTGTNSVYSSSFPLPLGRTLVTVTAKDQAGHVSTDTFSVVRSLGTIPDLTISHPAGTNDSVLHVSIKSSIVDAVIKYTVDGSDPTTSPTALTYSTPVLIDQTRTLKAVATASNRTPSTIASRVYTLVLPALIPNLPAGTSADTTFTAQISCRISGVTIHFTLDGTTPTSNSPSYSPIQAGGPISIEIDSIRTLKAIAIKPGWSNSPVAILPYKANVPIKVYSSSEATAVIRADGSLWTTGRGVALMDGSLGDRSEFAKVMDSVKDVTESHILRLNGDLYAYGNNDSGQFGNGTKTSSNTPIFIRSNVKKVSDGRYFSLIIDQSNTMHAAGSNSLGAFCNGTFINNATYSSVQTGIRDMAAGFSNTPFGDHMWTLFVTTAGDAYSCGTGPLGNGTSNQSGINTAQLVGSGYSAAYTTEGEAQHGGSFLVKTNGEAYSTHYNATQYLVPLTQPSAADTTFVLIRSGVKMIAGSYGNFFVLQMNGDLWGSGHNASGSLGDGTQLFIDQPKLILSEAIFVAASRFNSFFIKANGAFWAVGDNSGFFGDGTTASKLSPVRIKLP